MYVSMNNCVPAPDDCILMEFLICHRKLPCVKRTSLLLLLPMPMDFSEQFPMDFSEQFSILVAFASRASFAPNQTANFSGNLKFAWKSKHSTSETNLTGQKTLMASEQKSRQAN